MTPTQIILAGTIISAGMLLQGVVGFGSGLFSIPLLLLAGIRFELALAMLPMPIAAQTGWNLYHYRTHIPWGPVWRVSIWRFAALPVGVWLLVQLASAEQATAKQVIGVVLLLVLAVQWLAKVKPVERVHRAWDVAAGLGSGLMAGAFGMGGPPIVLWVAAHDWPAKRSRAFLWCSFLIFMPPWIGLVIWQYGWPIIEVMAWSLTFIPAILLAAHVGGKVGDRFNRHRLRQVAMGLLVLIAISAIVGPLIG